MGRELLGEVTSPSGTVMVVDMGLLNLWSHSEPPVLPEWSAPPETVTLANAALDFRVDGPDAAAAADVFGKTPAWLYDRPQSFAAVFASDIAERGLNARLVPASARVPHRQRVEHALDNPRRAGVVEFHGVWAPCVGSLPTDAVMKVYGTRMGVGDFSDCWAQVELEVREGTVAATERVGEALVDEARLALVDVDSLSAWQHETPIDGKADFVFWGRDAAAAAAASAAPDLGDGQHGWLDRPVEQAVELGTAVEELRESGKLLFATDFRPHSHHHQMMAKVRTAPTGSGTLTIGDARMCAFMTSWGDGIFPVEVDRDADGSVLTVRLVMATEETLENMRAVNTG